MSDVASSPFQQAYAELLARVPENHIEPRLDPVRRLCDVLGNPERAYPVIHVTGTNGKTSTARLIESLISAHDLRVGRFTSPHLTSVTERISIDGEPISAETFVQTWEDISAQVAIVDGELTERGESALTYFEVLAALGFAAFAEAPVDVAVIEVGLGGTWDATNVVTPEVSVITPIGLDHQDMLGDTIAEIAGEKAGIIKPSSVVVSARQHEDAVRVIADRASTMGVQVVWEGQDFAVGERTLAVGGQLVTCQGVASIYDGLMLGVHGAHQAQNAAVAVAATEMFFGRGKRALAGEVLERGFGAFTTPGRLEVVRPSPLVVVDAAHNPHGLEHALAGMREAFDARRITALFGVLGDKDAEVMLGMLEPECDDIVITQSSSPRAVEAGELGKLAAEVFGEERVYVEPHLPDAVARACDVAETGDALGSAVLATGSVTIAADVRLLHGKLG